MAPIVPKLETLRIFLLSTEAGAASLSLPAPSPHTIPGHSTCSAHPTAPTSFQSLSTAYANLLPLSALTQNLRFAFQIFTALLLFRVLIMFEIIYIHFDCLMDAYHH